jgi:hypothetical protein
VKAQYRRLIQQPSKISEIFPNLQHLDRIKQN